MKDHMSELRTYLRLSTRYLLVRVLCRTKLLPVTHVLVDIRMLTGKPVYKLSIGPDDLKWTTNTHMTQFTLARHNQQ